MSINNNSALCSNEDKRNISEGNQNETNNRIQLYTVPEVAQILRVKKSYVYELIYSNRLPAIRLSERRIRIRENALQKFIQSNNGVSN